MKTLSAQEKRVYDNMLGNLKLFRKNFKRVDGEDDQYFECRCRGGLVEFYTQDQPSDKMKHMVTSCLMVVFMDIDKNGLK